MGTSILLANTAASPNDGKTWHGRVASPGPEHANAWSGLFLTGTELVTFSNSKKLTSLDGVTWSSSTVSIPAAARGPIARAANGTYVSIPNNWGGYYEKQLAYRSLDGITWVEVANFPGRHPIARVTSGLLTACVAAQCGSAASRLGR